MQRSHRAVEPRRLRRVVERALRSNRRLAARGARAPARPRSAPRRCRRCAGRATSAGRARRRRPGAAPAGPGSRSTTSRVAARVSTSSPAQASRLSPFWNTTSAPAAPRRRRGAARTRAGRCWASGSDGRRPRRHRPAAPSRRSASWSRRRRPWPSPPPHAPQRRASATAASATAAARTAQPRRAARAPPPEQRTRAPASTAIVAPGGAFVFTDSHSPTVPSTAASATVPARQAGRRSVQMRTVAAGLDEQRRDEQRSQRRERGTITSAIRTSSNASGSATARRARCAAPGSNPVTSQARPRRRGRHHRAARSPRRRSRGRAARSATGCRTAASRRSTRVEHVAGEDHAERERAGQDERRQAVVAAAPAAPRAARGRPRTRAPRRARPIGAAKPRPPPARAPGKRRPDRVRVEGQAAQDDPGPEDPGPDREQQHLEQPALDELKLEGGRGGSPSRRGYQIMGIVIILTAISTYLSSARGAGTASAVSGSTTRARSCGAPAIAPAAHGRRCWRCPRSPAA